MNSGRRTALSPIGMCYLENMPSLKHFWTSTTAFPHGRDATGLRKIVRVEQRNSGSLNCP